MKRLLLLMLAMMISITAFAATTESNKKQKESLTTTIFAVDIDCQGCATKIMNYLPYKGGIKEVDVNFEEQRVTVTHNPSKCNEAKLIAHLKKIDITAKALPAKKLEPKTKAKE